MKRMPEALVDGTFDLLILGGGITGAGVALDAVTRGLRVALIDRGDFASGTSSISSKLIHGGLRYLEHGDFRLVYEALHERRLLLRNAPHLVHPLRFLLPFWQGSRVPAWKWRLGLFLYDLLAGRGNIRRSRSLPLHQLRREVPDLRPEGLLGGAEYHDAQMDDARLCLEVLLTASEQGAVVVNHVEAIAFEKHEGIIHGVRALDRVSGRELSIRARQVLNATGPWVDAVCRLAGETDPPHLRPTKGVHLIAPDRGLESALLLLHPRDGRVFFVIPWMGKTLIGTTDTAEDAPPGEIRVTDEDIDYLLEGFNHHFQTPLSPRGLLSHFVGVRPLLRARPSEPSAISREFRVFAGSSGLISVAGGKYTTYRHMAEVITDELTRRLGIQGRERTSRTPLEGTPREPWSPFRDRTLTNLQAQGLSGATAWHLVHRYGRHAEDIAELIRSSPALGQPIHPEEPDVRAELVYQGENEMAIFTDDFLLRRTRIGLFHPDHLSRARQASRLEAG